MPVARSIWIDDSGSGLDGTILNNAELQKIYDNIDLAITSASFAAVLPKATTDAVMATGGYFFGGTGNVYRRHTAIPAGATYDLIAPGTGVLRIDPTWMTGTWRLEVLAKIEPGGAGVVGSVALVNLTTAPDTPLVTLTTSSETGEIVRSGDLNFGAGGANRLFALKCWSNNASYGVNVQHARLYKNS